MRTTRAVLGRTLLLGIATATTLSLSCSDEVSQVAAAEEVLDRLHQAASVADGAAYFSVFAPDAVFLGTAAEERWDLEAFRAFAEPYFSAGRGWTYVPRAGGRHVDLTPDGQVAWFDEILDNEKYGECRGTGVLRRIEGSWRIAQYNLMIPIPNDIAAEVVARIREPGSVP